MNHLDTMTDRKRHRRLTLLCEFHSLRLEIEKIERRQEQLYHSEHESETYARFFALKRLLHP